MKAVAKNYFLKPVLSFKFSQDTVFLKPNKPFVKLGIVSMSC